MSDTQDGGGFLGQSPDFMRNLANFGANLSVAANQRNANGFLTYGQGIGGPLGAATLANQQYQAQQPYAMGELARQHAGLENDSASLQNQLLRASLPFQMAKTNAGMQALTGDGGAQPDVAASVPNIAPFGHRLASVESSGNPALINDQGYIGKYQFGAAALKDAGVYKPAPGEDVTKNQWKGTFVVPGQPWQPQTIGGFLGKPQMQDAAFAAHTQNLEKEIKSRGLDQYIGQTVGGVPITQESLIAGMHLAGPSGMAQFLSTNGKYSPQDANGTTIPKYASMVAGPQQPAQAGPDPMALANQHYARAKQLAWVNPEMAKVEQDQGDKWFDVAQAGPKAGAVAQAEVGPAAQKAKAAADAEAAASRTRLISTRSGIYDSLKNTEVYRAPEFEHLVGPHGTEYPAFVQPNEDGGLNIYGGPPGTKPGQVPPTKMAPGPIEAMKEAAERFGGENEVKQFHAAQMALSGAKAMENDFNTLNSTPGYFNTGSGVETKVAAAKWVNSALGTMGINPGFDPNKIASFEDLQRQTKLAGDQLTNQFFGGGREAASTIMNSQKAVAGAGDTPKGALLGVATIREVARMGIDRRNFMTNWMLDPKNEGDMRSAEEQFYKQRTPESYALRARSIFDPVRINSPGALKNLLPGTKVIAPDGKTTGLVGGEPDIAVNSPPVTQ